jgi:hypothetical protein
MDGKSDFIEGAKKSLAPVLVQEVDIDEGVKRIEVEGGSIDLDVFRAKKVEKAVFSTIRIHAQSVAEQSVLVWPEDTYDLPIFWCNLSQMPNMNMAIFDFLPLMDVVVWPQYAEKYLKGLAQVKEQALGILEDGIVDTVYELSTVIAHAISPCKVILKVTEAGAARVPRAVDEYSKAYITHWEEAEPLQVDGELDFCKRKKGAIKRLMKENDPGYPFMVKVFGEEKTRKVFDIIF